ncbi:MAG: hypothetical protein AAB781_01145 [Patescibacteria group bacterium]
MLNKTRLSDLFAFLSVGEGGIIEGKSGHFLTSTFNYEIRFNLDSDLIHDVKIVKRLLNGEIRLAQTPKKLYPARDCRGRIEIIGRPFSWKGISN